MQVKKSFRSRGKRILVYLAFFVCLVFSFAISIKTLASSSVDTVYNNQTDYSAFAYGTAPADSSDTNGNPITSGNGGGSANSGGSQATPKPVTTQILSKFAAPVSGLTNLVSRQLAKLTPAQRNLIPFFTWYVLIGTALLLFTESYIDRRRSNLLAKYIEKLRAAIQAQKNFSHLVAHYLNTPLATIRNLLELLEKSKTDESVAVQALRPPTLGLAATVEYANQAATASDAAEQSAVMPQNKQNILTSVRHWNFIIPVVVGLLFALLTNWSLYRLGDHRSTSTILYQVGIGVVAIVIFANALHIRSVARNQQIVLQTLKTTTEKLSQGRKNVLASLNANLSNIVKKLNAGVRNIHDQNVSRIFYDSLTGLESLTSKVNASLQPISAAPELCQLPTISKKLTDAFQARLVAKQLTVKTNFNIDRPIYTHTKELEFMLKSLLENAIEYSNNGGVVTLGASIKDNHLFVSVNDQGSGISTANQAQLFNPFTKTDDVYSTEHQGIGLSLYVCKNIANRLGGDILVKSKVQEGTEADILLPLGA